MEYVVTKINAAADQLDWAVRLFLEHQAYVPAITLAGAAEEVMGSLLGGDSVHGQLKRTLAGQSGLPEKLVSDEYLNRARNWLKHWSELRDAEAVSMDLENEAIQYIVRGMVNFVLHDRSLPNEGPRFFSWLQENRSDLYAF